MKAWALNIWHALLALVVQFLLVVDQMGNVLLPGAMAVLNAVFTGKRQNVAYADETLSAHAWRAYHRGRIWGLLCMPLIDLLFIWQGQDEDVNRAAGQPVTGHCRRAYWKERLRRDMPPEYRERTLT